jgi:hypothetical protein
MPEQSARAHMMLDDSFGMNTVKQLTTQTRDIDPVLAAIEAAPWVQLSDEEEAQLDEIERSATRTIPYDEFVSSLGMRDEP